MIYLDQVFCDIDDFSAVFAPQWKEELLQGEEVKRCKGSSLSLSEVMRIIIVFHSSNFRTFKHFYPAYVMQRLGGAFPRLVSYNRMVELMQLALISLCSYLRYPPRASHRYQLYRLDADRRVPPQTGPFSPAV